MNNLKLLSFADSEQIWENRFVSSIRAVFDSELESVFRGVTTKLQNDSLRDNT